MAQYSIIWTIKELVDVLRNRQLNKFDCNFGVSGKRGDGKSTFMLKIFKSFKKYGFIQKKHQVYSQKDVTNLLAAQIFGFCWDDEAINSGYKRNFQHAGQKILIQIITNYRDNFNLYGSAVPFFYSLDKALRELMFMHVHIIERGLAVIFLPLADQVHSQDPWDTNNNIKIEEREYRRMKKFPNSKFRWHKFSTFAGYIYFGPMSQHEGELYDTIKKEKRYKNFEQSGAFKDQEDLSFIDKVYKLIKERKLTKEGLQQACLVEGKKYSNIMNNLNVKLKNEGELRKSIGDFFLILDDKAFHSKGKGLVNDLVPDLPS
jgi:hypothetical protein